MHLSPLEPCWKETVLHIVDIDGVGVPSVFTSIKDEALAVRRSVGISDLSSVAVLRVSGRNALDLVNRVTPSFLRIKSNQMQHTVLITDDRLSLADLYVCKDHDDYLLLSRGMPAERLAAWLTAHQEASEELSLTLMNRTHAVIALNGPFCWELLADLEDPEIISLPYLSFYSPGPDRIIFRAGESGEFGYLLLYPIEEAAAAWEQICEAGAAFDLALVGFSALEHCALENMFFNVRKEGALGATPAELQLQWRVSYAKPFSFSEPLRRGRRRTLQRRLTAIACAECIEEGRNVLFGENRIGTVVNAAPFHSGTGFIGLAMLDLPYAESGVNSYHVLAAERRVAVRTVSPPFVNNRSLYVDPQIHAYQEAETIPFPPLDCVNNG
jgi:aminomethyltransferase